MILGFRKNFPWGEPTYFREKILAGVGLGPFEALPKIHSIRNGNRWDAGMSIQMANGVRTKEYVQFNKDIPELETCHGTQTIHIAYEGKKPIIFVDNKELSPDMLVVLAVNDGFFSLEHFSMWFKKDFKGQIVHWTAFRY